MRRDDEEGKETKKDGEEGEETTEFCGCGGHFDDRETKIWEVMRFACSARSGSGYQIGRAHV